jgi:hypothetical protein
MVRLLINPLGLRAYLGMFIPFHKEGFMEAQRIEECFRSQSDLAGFAADTLSHQYRILVQYEGSKEKPTLWLKRSDWSGTETICKTTEEDLRDLWVAWKISDGMSNKKNLFDNREMVLGVWMEKQRNKHS